MADILHEVIFSSLNFGVQPCPRVGGQCPPLSKVGGGGGKLPHLPPFSYTTAECIRSFTSQRTKIPKKNLCILVDLLEHSSGPFGGPFFIHQGDKENTCVFTSYLLTCFPPVSVVSCV